MQNAKVQATIKYMMRNLLMANITDPLTDAQRGNSDYSLKFSGTGASGQINYLDRKLVSGGRMIVSVGGVVKTPVTDYIYSSSSLTITWVAYTPPSGNDNITVSYQAVKSWIYDDHPYADSNTYPRMTVSMLPLEYETPGMGVYQNYNAGPGNLVTCVMKIIIRNRKGTQTYTYGNINYQNYDLLDAISESIKQYINTTRQNRPWKYYDWEFKRSERVETEEDSGIFRADNTIKLRYYDKSSP